MTILFLHGWNSVPGGVKPTYLKDHGHEVINPALPDEDFGEAVCIAQAEFDKHHPQVVVGSSRGGAVAMNIKSGAAKLVLLCPAWKKYGTARTLRPDTVILHSRADDVIPFANSEELATNSGATLIEVGDDHRLADPEPLAAMLRACGEAVGETSGLEQNPSPNGGPIMEFNIQRQGRKWSRAEIEQKYHDLCPEKIELIEGKMFWSDEQRVNMLALLLENVGMDAAVKLGDPALWKQAIDERLKAQK